MSGIDPQTAVSTLTDIERVQRRALAELNYISASRTYFLWGALSSFGYLFGYVYPSLQRTVWTVIILAGMATMLAISQYERGKSLDAKRRRGRDNRPITLQFLAVGFGYLWFFLLDGPSAGYRASSTFFPTLFMFAVTVIGLWYGRFFIYTGLTVTALVIAVNLWSGPWYDLLMAVCVGGVLITVGFWFRHLGKQA